MTQNSTGKHAATTTPRRLLLPRPDVARRGRYAGRRIAEASVAVAARRPATVRLVPLGALLVAAAGGVTTLALPGHHDDTAPTSSTRAANRTWRPPAAPQTFSPGVVATPAAFVRPAAGKHRPEPEAPAAADATAHPAGTASTTGRHRADVVPQQSRAAAPPTTQPSAPPTTRPTTRPGAGPGVDATRTAQPARTEPAAPVPAPTTARTKDGGLVDTLVDTVGGAVDGVVGGLLGGRSGD